MGNYSILRGTRNNANDCIINWDAMDISKLYKNFILEDEHKKPAVKRAKSLGEMAELWNSTKFVGYFDNDTITALCEFSRNLLQYGCRPRLYYEFEGWNQLWCLEFVPGTTIINYSILVLTPYLEMAPKHPELCGIKATVENETAWMKSEASFMEKLCDQLIISGKWSSSRRLCAV